ncbi:MAG: YaiI/YqxD family protein [Desulfomonilia bacterium]
MEIYVDADACPVKDEVFRVARRYGFKVYLVSNTGIRIPKDVLVEMVVVKDHFDAADDWITENIHDNDIAVSADIPLASRCLKNGARVIDPKGRVFTRETIGDALANRELSAYLRDMGNNTHGTAPFGKRDRSRFLQHLDGLIQAVLRGK